MSRDVLEALRESEQRYRTLIEQTPVGVFLYDRDLVITEFNARFVEILQSTADKLRGLAMRDLRDRRIIPILERAIEGEAAQYEGPYAATTSAAQLHILLRVAPLRDAGGQVVGALGLAEDITERARAEEALRRSEARFRTLIENAPDAICVYPPGDRRLVYANPALASLLSYDSPHELLSQPVDLLIHPDDRHILERRWARLAHARGALPAQEYRMLRRDGGIVHAEIVSMIIDYDGEPHVIAFGRDLTERKQMQARLLLADRMVSVGTLAAGVAHEINNPLAYVMSNLEMVGTRRLPPVVARLRDLGSEPARELAEQVAQAIAMIDVALEGSARMRDIVRDLRTVTRAADEETRAAVDVRRVLDASINLAWNEIRHRARLVKEYDEVPPVVANEGRLGQVFLNLLVNAAQALQVGAASENVIRVAASTDRAGHVVVEVSDTGPGIAAEILDRIFDPFFTTKPVGVGTGLGLWICQGIVTSLGGQILAESQPGAGATFRVILPSATTTVQQQAAEPARGAVTPAPPKRFRLLIVDDEIAIGRTLSIALGDAFDVTTATSGREALALLEDRPRDFDVVLCDLMMPDVSGMDVYERIVVHAPALARRFVFVTGGAFTERARAFIERVQAPVIEKPFDLTALPDLLRTQAAS